MIHSRFVPVALAATLALAGAGVAVASSDDHQKDSAREVGAVLNASATLVQAIAAAERETGGKAIDAGIDDRNGGFVYAVKIAKGDVLQKVHVALDDGKVLDVKAVEHHDDEDDDGDHD